MNDHKYWMESISDKRMCTADNVDSHMSQEMSQNRKRKITEVESVKED